MPSNGTQSASTTASQSCLQQQEHLPAQAIQTVRLCLRSLQLCFAWYALGIDSSLALTAKVPIAHLSKEAQAKLTEQAASRPQGSSVARVVEMVSRKCHVTNIYIT